MKELKSNRDMGGIDLNSNDWCVHCSDEELSNSAWHPQDETSWAPEPNELNDLYDEIERSGTLALDWKCPGRRAPSPIASNKESQADTTNQRSNQDEKSDFDFMDEVTSLRLRVRREGEDTLRGSAKKKTTSFDGIVSNMMRHKRLEQMERDGSISSPSPATPNPS